MASFLKLTEYPQEGIAIVEDNQGKYLVTAGSDTIIPLPDYHINIQRQHTPMQQSRSAMMS